jgi:hypothetical protein
MLRRVVDGAKAGHIKDILEILEGTPRNACELFLKLNFKRKSLNSGIIILERNSLTC